MGPAEEGGAPRYAYFEQKQPEDLALRHEGVLDESGACTDSRVAAYHRRLAVVVELLAALVSTSSQYLAVPNADGRPPA